MLASSDCNAISLGVAKDTGVRVPCWLSPGWAATT
jgi:hypothetical protein